MSLRMASRPDAVKAASASRPRPLGAAMPAAASLLVAERVPLARVLLSWLLGLLGMAAVIVVALQFGSLLEMLELARSARPVWLLLALLAQAATYLAEALIWRQSLRRSGHPRPLRALVPLGIAKLFTDQVIPSGGVSGTMLIIAGLIRRRVPAEITMAAMLVGLVSYYAAYVAVVLASIVILWLHGRASLLILIGGALFVAITVAIPTAILALKRWGGRGPVARLSEMLGAARLSRALAEAPTDLLRSPVLLLQTAGLQATIFVLDGLTLWLVLMSVGCQPGLWVPFVSFTIASMAATIGPVPLGLGSFEAGSVGMLGFLGVSVEAALAGTLLLRGLTFWLPMLPGIWLARREIGRLH